MRTAELQIRTPEGIVFSQLLAGPVTRCLAWVIDFFCVLALVKLLTVVALLLGVFGANIAMAFYTLGYFVVSIGYGITCEWAWRGQTVGKKLFRLRVIDAEGMRLQFNQIVTRKGGGMEMMRMLRQNWHVGVPLDLDVRKGVFVDFFGKLASTSDGVARLARATGAPVVPCFMVREGDTTHHKIQIQPPVEIVKSKDAEADHRENTQRFVKAIEKAIREHPDHWNWIHRRWKTRPPGEARFY